MGIGKKHAGGMLSKVLTPRMAKPRTPRCAEAEHGAPVDPATHLLGVAAQLPPPAKSAAARWSPFRSASRGPSESRVPAASVVAASAASTVVAAHAPEHSAHVPTPGVAAAATAVDEDEGDEDEDEDEETEEAQMCWSAVFAFFPIIVEVCPAVARALAPLTRAAAAGPLHAAVGVHPKA